MSYLAKNYKRKNLSFKYGKGSYLFSTKNKKYLEAQDIFEEVMLIAPKGVWHGDSIFIGDEELDECWILDIFSPPRDDLRESSG